MYEDWDLIESSIAQQYGIRIRKEIQTMDWAELSSYISGLNGETSLGNIIRIRSEKNPDALKNFSQNELKIRNEWLSKTASQINKEDYKQAMEGIKNMFISMASKGDDRK